MGKTRQTTRKTAPFAGRQHDFHRTINKPNRFIPKRDCEAVMRKNGSGGCPSTPEGGAKVLAAGTSVGHKMAGVWFHSDHLDGSGTGEVMAIGILEAQALSYPNDDFVSSLPKFDGGMVRIGNR